MKRSPWFQALFLAVAFPWPVLAGPPQPTAVKLQFAWPVGLTAKVTRTAGADGPYGAKALGVADRSYRIVIREAGGGLRLDSTELGPEAEGFSAMMDPLPTILFDHDGAFVGFIAPENNAGQRMMEAMRKAMPLPPEKQKEVQAQLDAVQEEVARDFWDKFVTPWRGLTLVPGQPFQRKTKIRLGAMFERVEVAADQTVTLQTGVQCTKATRARTCVKLISDTRPEKTWEAERAPEDFRMKRSNASIHFELVVDPGTLVPYSAVTRREDLVIRGKADGGEYEGDKFLQVDQYLFVYESVPSRKKPVSL